MKRFVGVTFLSLGFMGLLCGVTFGESYPNGSEGIKGPSLPPPGFYYKMYNVYIKADDLMDTNGDEMSLDFEMKWFVNVHRFIWMYGHIDFLGADIGADIIFPIWHKDTRLVGGPFDFDDNAWRFGDIFFEPLDIIWRGKQYDIGFALGFFLPTGKHTDLKDPGEDMYTTLFTFGVTYYFDKAKTWSFALLPRYEIHGRKREGNDYLTSVGLPDHDTKPGDDFHFEWGLGKTLPKGWEVGLVGYCQWQLEEDKGSTALPGKDRAYATGPEVSFFYPPWMTQFTLRSFWEFGVEGRASGRPEGNRTFFIVTKKF
ncbi:conserved hypothetical protein [uncultured Desulfobacterium sp.]|uniref:Transporter n=1 Tax=uncultured Desulfobacterium sp. TaxID=201089 RepID=A0A445MT78_9BACT|nr:conserved hypothetical protein [uncultured Desulfobacterium sp.]